MFKQLLLMRFVLAGVGSDLITPLLDPYMAVFVDKRIGARRLSLPSVAELRDCCRCRNHRHHLERGAGRRSTSALGACCLCTSNSG